MNSFRKGRLAESVIMQWLTDLRHHAYVPESGFAVSAVFRARLHDADDYYFGGVNVENIDHRLSTHAEEGCIAAMVSGLGKRVKIVEGWVMGAPKNMQASDTLVSCCGKCRQQIAGFANKDVRIHSVSLSGRKSSTTIGEFLPDLFTFRQYLPDIADIEEFLPDLFASRQPPPDTAHPKAVAPSVAEVKNKMIRRSQLSEKEIFTWLKEIESVEYASKVSQSIVIKIDNGAYVAGGKVEEAAFNSISAAQSSLALAVAEFGVCAVQEVWVYTKGRDGKEIPSGHFGSLAMSALQTILQCAEDDEIPISFFAEDGGIIYTALSDAATIAPTSGRPFHKKP